MEKDEIQYKEDVKAGVQMSKTNEREWEKEFDEIWSTKIIDELNGNKPTAIPDFGAIKDFIRKVEDTKERQTIARCRETVKNSRTVNETYGVGLNETNARMQAIADLTSLNKTI